MDRTKTTSPQSSIDHHDIESTDQSNKVVGRFYECNFCKGRFTNAQALGGHMNIHRKEKANIKASRGKPAKDQKHHHMMMMNDVYDHENCGSSDQVIINNMMGSNLSLTIGKLYHEDINIEGGIEWINDDQINGNNELDLELRLGYK